MLVCLISMGAARRSETMRHYFGLVERAFYTGTIGFLFVVAIDLVRAAFVGVAERSPHDDTRSDPTTDGDDMTIALNVPGLPFTLSPSSESAWTIAEAPATVTAWAAPHSDIFIDPGADSPLSAEPILNATTLLGVPPDGDFQFSAHVTVEFASTYDAGVLLLSQRPPLGQALLRALPTAS